MAGIFGQAFHRSTTQEKAINDFRMCGIWPYDEIVFTDEDFAAATVTDQPEPCNDEAVATDDPDVHVSEMPSTTNNLSDDDEEPADPQSLGPSSSNDRPTSGPSSSGKTLFSGVRPSESDSVTDAAQLTNLDGVVHRQSASGN